MGLARTVKRAIGRVRRGQEEQAQEAFEGVGANFDAGQIGRSMRAGITKNSDSIHPAARRAARSRHMAGREKQS